MEVLSPDGRQLASYKYGSLIWSLAWAPDGRLAVGGRSSIVRVWPTETGTSGTEFRHSGAIAALAWSSDGRLASGGGDGTIREWDTNADTGAPDVGAWTSAVAFAPDKRLASGHEDGTVRVWPAGGGAPAVYQHGHPVRSIAWAPDGRLAAASDDGRINVWSGGNHEPTALDQDGRWVQLAWSSDGRLAAGCDDGVRIWPIDGSNPVLHCHSVISAVAWTPDGRLFTGSLKSVREVLADGDAKTLYTHSTYLAGLSCGPDGRLACAFEDGAVCIWADDEQTWLDVTHDSPLTAIAWTPSGLVTGFHDGMVQIVDARAPGIDPDRMSPAETLPVFRLNGVIDAIAALDDVIACSTNGVLSVLRIHNLE